MLAFLDAVPSLGDVLLVTGDLYDFWYTWPRVIPRHAVRTTAALIALARRMPVAMVGGNHDRWGSGFWDAEAGLAFHSHRLDYQLGAQRLFLLHGDGLHREHLRANLLNRLINSPAVIRAFALVPPGLGFWMADRFQHDPAYAASRPEIVVEGARRQRAIAERLLVDDPGRSAVIMGHTHHAVAEEIFPGRWYLNPGAWLDGHRYGILSPGGATLHRFS